MTGLMQVWPIIVALRRHKMAVLLIALQIALSLAIVCNALFIIVQRIERIDRPSGLREPGLIRILQLWPGISSLDDVATLARIDAWERADLETLRRVPGVQEVAASEDMPLSGGYSSGQFTRTLDQAGAKVRAVYYYGDEHMRSALGLRLIAGRDFRADEIHAGRASPDTSVVIVSQPVAEQLFPQGNALGQTIYQDGKAVTVIGMVERLQAPTAWAGNDSWAYNSVLEPVRVDGAYAGYVLRVQPGREQVVMRAARQALFAANPMRVMDDTWGGIHAFSELRERAYRADRRMALMMGAVCVILLFVTASGIVGLSGFWAAQRHRQMGVRRALGARKSDIRAYFQLENLLITGAAAMAGGLCAFALNQWLMAHLEMDRLPAIYVGIGMLVMLALGQLAVLAPARRASKVPPVVATRAA